MGRYYRQSFPPFSSSSGTTFHDSLGSLEVCGESTHSDILQKCLIRTTTQFRGISQEAKPEGILYVHDIRTLKEHMHKFRISTGSDIMIITSSNTIFMEVNKLLDQSCQSSVQLASGPVLGLFECLFMLQQCSARPFHIATDCPTLVLMLQQSISVFSSVL